MSFSVDIKVDQFKANVRDGLDKKIQQLSALRWSINLILVTKEIQEFLHALGKNL